MKKLLLGAREKIEINKIFDYKNLMFLTFTFEDIKNNEKELLKETINFLNNQCENYALIKHQQKNKLFHFHAIAKLKRNSILKANKHTFNFALIYTTNLFHKYKTLTKQQIKELLIEDFIQKSELIIFKNITQEEIQRFNSEEEKLNLKLLQQEFEEMQNDIKELNNY